MQCINKKKHLKKTFMLIPCVLAFSGFYLGCEFQENDDSEESVMDVEGKGDNAKYSPTSIEAIAGKNFILPVGNSLKLTLDKSSGSMLTKEFWVPIYDKESLEKVSDNLDDTTRQNDIIEIKAISKKSAELKIQRRKQFMPPKKTGESEEEYEKRLSAFKPDILKEYVVFINQPVKINSVELTVQGTTEKSEVTKAPGSPVHFDVNISLSSEMETINLLGTLKDYSLFSFFAPTKGESDAVVEYHGCPLHISAEFQKLNAMFIEEKDTTVTKPNAIKVGHGRFAFVIPKLEEGANFEYFIESLIAEKGLEETCQYLMSSNIMKVLVTKPVIINDITPKSTPYAGGEVKLYGSGLHIVKEVLVANKKAAIKYIKGDTELGIIVPSVAELISDYSGNRIIDATIKAIATPDNEGVFTGFQYELSPDEAKKRELAEPFTVSQVNPTTVTYKGGKMTVYGKNLHQISAINIGSKKASIIQKSITEVSFSAPGMNEKYLMTNCYGNPASFKQNSFTAPITFVGDTGRQVDFGTITYEISEEEKAEREESIQNAFNAAKAANIAAYNKAKAEADAVYQKNKTAYDNAVTAYNNARSAAAPKEHGPIYSEIGCDRAFTELTKYPAAYAEQHNYKIKTNDKIVFNLIVGKGDSYWEKSPSFNANYFSVAGPYNGGGSGKCEYWQFIVTPRRATSGERVTFYRGWTNGYSKIHHFMADIEVVNPPAIPPYPTQPDPPAYPPAPQDPPAHCGV